MFIERTLMIILQKLCLMEQSCGRRKLLSVPIVLLFHLLLPMSSLIALSHNAPVEQLVEQSHFLILVLHFLFLNALSQVAMYQMYLKVTVGVQFTVVLLILLQYLLLRSSLAVVAKEEAHICGESLNSVL